MPNEALNLMTRKTFLREKNFPPDTPYEGFTCARIRLFRRRDERGYVLPGWVDIPWTFQGSPLGNGFSSGPGTTWVPAGVGMWLDDSGAFLRFYEYPRELWGYLRSTNLMERFIREVRRGTKVRDHRFPAEAAAYRP